MSDIRLNQFRALDEGARGDAAPEPRRRRVFVDREGRIVVGDEEPGRDEGRQLSEIHPAVFAAGSLCLGPGMVK